MPFHLLTVRCLERAKTTTIKWLSDVRGVSREPEEEDVMGKAESHEISRAVAAMAVRDKDSWLASCEQFCLLLEHLFKPKQSQLIVCVPIGSYSIVPA